MKKIIVCLLALLLATPVYADKQQKIEELFQLTMDENMEKVMDNTFQMAFAPMGCVLKMTPKDEADLKKQFMDIMDVNGMMKEVLPLYAKYFTEEDLDAMLVFMKSPVGRKFMSTMPQLSADMMVVVQKWMGQKGPQLQELGKQLGTKYQKRSDDEVKQCLKDRNINF